MPNFFKPINSQPRVNTNAEPLNSHIANTTLFNEQLTDAQNRFFRGELTDAQNRFFGGEFSEVQARIAMLTADALRAETEARLDALYKQLTNEANHNFDTAFKPIMNRSSRN